MEVRRDHCGTDSQIQNDPPHMVDKVHIDRDSRNVSLVEMVAIIEGTKRMIPYE